MSDDLIKREDAINAINQVGWLEDSEYESRILAIPSADRPQGKWKAFDLKWGREIYACTSCEESVEVPTCMGKPLFKFCPLCGCRMKGADDEID